jgi:prevent-host-death family protein
MSQVMLEDANSQLARLVEQAGRGEEVIIVRDSTPVAKIVPLPEEKPVSHFGNAKDVLIYMADDFDAPLEDFKDYM